MKKHIEGRILAAQRLRNEFEDVVYNTLVEVSAALTDEEKRLLTGVSFNLKTISFLDGQPCISYSLDDIKKIGHMTTEDRYQLLLTMLDVLQ